MAATLRRYCEASSDGADGVVLVQFGQNFWPDVTPQGHAERVFFRHDGKEHCGVVLLTVADPELRETDENSSPLERNYSEYGVFPEEKLR